jgi:hypothetical protein
MRTIYINCKIYVLYINILLDNKLVINSRYEKEINTTQKIYIYNFIIIINIITTIKYILM